MPGSEELFPISTYQLFDRRCYRVSAFSFHITLQLSLRSQFRAMSVRYSIGELSGVTGRTIKRTNRVWDKGSLRQPGYVESI